MDFLSNKTTKVPKLPFIHKVCFTKHFSRAHLLPKLSMCTLGGIPQEVVNSFLTCVAQDNDLCLQAIDCALTFQCPYPRDFGFKGKAKAGL